MCLIAVKKKGEKMHPFFYKAIARSYHLRNNDGMGFAIKKGHSNIYLSKGYETLESFINAIKKQNPDENSELLVHLRRVSAGDKNVENCHPYVCSDNVLEATSEEGFFKKPVLAHNGTISSYRNNEGYSDTLNFILKFVGKANGGGADVIRFLAKNKEHMCSTLIGTSRLAIMYSGNRSMELYNKFTKYSVNNKSTFYFSNDSYTKDPIDHKPYSYNGYHC